MAAFERSEFMSRVSRVQAQMNELDIGALFVTSPENIYYLTGYQTSGYFEFQAAIVPADGNPKLLVRLVELGNVPEYSWLPESSVRVWRDGDDLVTHAVEALTTVVESRGRIGLEKEAWFPNPLFQERLSVALDRYETINASWLVDRVRTIKSPREIDYLRRAAQISELQIEAAINSISPGTTEADVAAAVYFKGIKAGSEYTGLPQHIQSGHRRNIGHANWSSKKIEMGELLRLELYGCVERYHATCVRTVSVGKADSETHRIADYVVDAQNDALSALKPGASSREVDALVRSKIRKIRPDYCNRSGYSTGIGFPPRTAEWDVLEFNEHSDWEIREGMVFHILTAAKGIGFSETVVITQSGAERLTARLPRELMIA